MRVTVSLKQIIIFALAVCVVLYCVSTLLLTRATKKELKDEKEREREVLPDPPMERRRPVLPGHLPRI